MFKPYCRFNIYIVFNNMHSGLPLMRKLPALQPESPSTHTETEVSDASCQAGDYQPLATHRRDLTGRPRPLSLTPFGHRAAAISPEVPDYIAALPSQSPLQRVSALISSPGRRLRASVEPPNLPKKQPVSTHRLQRCLYPRFNPILLDVEGFNPRHRTRSRWLSMRGSPHFCLIKPLAAHSAHRRIGTIRTHSPLA